MRRVPTLHIELEIEALSIRVGLVCDSYEDQEAFLARLRSQDWEAVGAAVSAFVSALDAGGRD